MILDSPYCTYLLGLNKALYSLTSGSVINHPYIWRNRSFSALVSNRSTDFFPSTRIFSRLSKYSLPAPKRICCGTPSLITFRKVTVEWPPVWKSSPTTPSHLACQRQVSQGQSVLTHLRAYLYLDFLRMCCANHTTHLNKKSIGRCAFQILPGGRLLNMRVYFYAASVDVPVACGKGLPAPQQLQGWKG